ncbi:MAG TPA: four helix bundle protein [Lentisphaeria bacterium]|nr:MAG: four helix bundle protein [Lentisphaerae bacterium GWF2_38_69]HBM15109.1 four helix bundle protein [Lentisphaeria bacterium]
MLDNGFITTHWNYKELLSYKKALIVYDATVLFCSKFLAKRDRTVAQMTQAARSGKQNIIEGCMASGTSKETEIKLINVARASLEELLEDYRDFLRTGNHAIWEKDSKEALYVRRLAYESHEAYETYREFFETRPSETVANILICLINQCNYLLDRQIARLEQDFVKEGGLRERMYNARMDFRNHNKY